MVDVTIKGCVYQCISPVEDVPDPGQRPRQPGARQQPRRQVQRHHVHSLQREDGVDVEVHRLQVLLHQENTQ